MSKKLIGVVGGVAVIAACWPYAVGMIAESKIMEKAQRSNDYVKIEVLDYKRGYLTSQSKTKVTFLDEKLIDLLDSNNLPITINLTSDMKHGLFGAIADSKLTDFPELPVHLETQYSFVSDMKNAFIIDPYSAEIEGGQFDSTEFRLTIASDSKVKTISSIDMTLDKVTWKNSDSLKLELNDLTGSFTGEITKDVFIGAGKGHFNLENFTLEHEEEEVKLAVNSITADVKSNVSGDIYTEASNIGVDKITFSQGDVQSEEFHMMDLSGASLNLSYGADYQTILEIAEVLNSLYSADSNDSYANMLAIPQLFQKLLAKGAYVDGFGFNLDEFNLNVKGWEDIEAQVKGFKGALNGKVVLNQITSEASQEISLDKFYFNQEGEGFDLDKAKLMLSSGKSKDDYITSFSLDLDKMNLNLPGVEKANLTDGDVKISYKLDYKSLIEAENQANALTNSILDGGQNMELLMSTIESVVTLVNKGASAGIDKLAFKINDSQVSGDLNVQLLENDLNQMSLEDDFPKFLTGTFNLSLDKTLSKTFPELDQTIDMLPLLGIENAVSKTEKTYEANGELKDGMIKFKEGFEMPLPL